MRMGDGGDGERGKEKERRVRGAPASLVQGAGHPPPRGEGRFPADRGLGGVGGRERHDYCYYY